MPGRAGARLACFPRTRRRAARQAISNDHTSRAGLARARLLCRGVAWEGFVKAAGRRRYAHRNAWRGLYSVEITQRSLRTECLFGTDRGARAAVLPALRGTRLPDAGVAGSAIGRRDARIAGLAASSGLTLSHLLPFDDTHLACQLYTARTRSPMLNVAARFHVFRIAQRCFPSTELHSTAWCAVAARVGQRGVGGIAIRFGIGRCIPHRKAIQWPRILLTVRGTGVHDDGGNHQEAASHASAPAQRCSDLPPAEAHLARASARLLLSPGAPARHSREY